MAIEALVVTRKAGVWGGVEKSGYKCKDSSGKNVVQLQKTNIRSSSVWDWSLQCLFSIPNGPGIEQELRPKPGWRGLGINPFQATDVAHGLKCRPTDPPATITSIYFLKSVCLSVCLSHRGSHEEGNK